MAFFFWGAFGMIIGWVGILLREAPTAFWQKTLLLLAGTIGGVLGGSGGLFLAQGAGPYPTSDSDMFFSVIGATACVIITSIVTDRTEAP